MSDFMSKVTEVTIKSKSEQLTNKLTEYMGERPIEPVKVYHEVNGDYVFFIAWAIAKDKNVFSHAYRMLVTSVMGEELYSDYNIICSQAYDLNTVKEKCKGYFSHYAKEFNNII